MREVGGKSYILMTTDMAALPKSRLGELVSNIGGADRDNIATALGFLFSGF